MSTEPVTSGFKIKLLKGTRRRSNGCVEQSRRIVIPLEERKVIGLELDFSAEVRGCAWVESLATEGHRI